MNRTLSLLILFLHCVTFYGSAYTYDIPSPTSCIPPLVTLQIPDSIACLYMGGTSAEEFTIHQTNMILISEAEPKNISIGVLGVVKGMPFPFNVPGGISKSEIISTNGIVGETSQSEYDGFYCRVDRYSTLNVTILVDKVPVIHKDAVDELMNNVELITH